MQELRIPCEGLTDEGFVAIKAQMRMFLNMPAEMLPPSVKLMYSAFAYVSEPNLKGCYHQFISWFNENGYEVMKADSYYVIRRRDPDFYEWKAINDKAWQDIDRRVINALGREAE